MSTRQELLRIAEAASRFEKAIRDYGIIVPDPITDLHYELVDAIAPYRTDFIAGKIPVTEAEVAQFMKECDEGKHPLSPEDQAALEKARDRLMAHVRKILSEPVTARKSHDKAQS